MQWGYFLPFFCCHTSEMSCQCKISFHLLPSQPTDLFNPRQMPVHKGDHWPDKDGRYNGAKSDAV